MRLNQRTLSAAVFTSMLLVTAAGCGKKAPLAPPPPRAPETKPTVEPPPPASLAARINAFTAEPRNIERGQSATLRWSVANATDISIDQNIGPVQANGSRQVFPSNTVTYTLTAKGANGSDTRSVTVEVSAPPPPPVAPPDRGGAVNGASLLSGEGQDA